MAKKGIPIYGRNGILRAYLPKVWDFSKMYLAHVSRNALHASCTLFMNYGTFSDLKAQKCEN